MGTTHCCSWTQSSGVNAFSTCEPSYGHAQMVIHVVSYMIGMVGTVSAALLITRLMTPLTRLQHALIAWIAKLIILAAAHHLKW